MPMRPLTISELSVRIDYDVFTGCWNWMGKLDPNGYGRTQIAGVGHPTHCVIYELCVGPTPEGWHLHHKCENRRCVNPLHCEPLTVQGHHKRHDHSQNGEHNRRLIRCKRNHEFTPENTQINRAGSRVCIQCKRIHGRNNMAKARAKLRAAQPTLEDN